jgi:hypothetical protein
VFDSRCGVQEALALGFGALAIYLPRVEERPLGENTTPVGCKLPSGLCAVLLARGYIACCSGQGQLCYK